MCDKLMMNYCDKMHPIHGDVIVHLKKKSHLSHGELELAHFLNNQR